MASGDMQARGVKCSGTVVHAMETQGAEGPFKHDASVNLSHTQLGDVWIGHSWGERLLRLKIDQA